MTPGVEKPREIGVKEVKMQFMMHQHQVNWQFRAEKLGIWEPGGLEYG